MLIKQFKQRYHKKNKFKHSLIIISLLAIVVSVILNTYRQTMPTIAIPIDTNYFKPFQQAFIPEKPDYEIIKEPASSATQPNELYLVTSCTDKNNDPRRLTPILKKANMKHAIQTEHINNKKCQRLVLGPIKSYQELNRAQHVLHKLKQKNPIITRR